MEWFIFIIFPFVLFLQEVGCSFPSTPTLSNRGTVTVASTAPVTTTQSSFPSGVAGACAQFSGGSSISDYIFTCPGDQQCAILVSGYRQDGNTGNNWGCCKEVPVPGCFTLNCPTYTSCIDSTALGSCDSDCASNTEVLKCTDSAKAFCATASAQITGTPEIELNPQSTYIASQYACADYPYDLIYTVLAEDIYLGAVCAPPWVTNPASLAAWSTSAASQVSYATMQDFADPFDQITYIITPSNFTVPPSTGITGSSSTTTSPLQTVQIPTTATVSSSSTSAAVKWAIPYIYIYSLLAIGHFLLYANL